MYFFISHLFFPSAVVGTLLVFLLAHQCGGNLEAAVLLPSMVVLLAAMLLERRWPFQPAWNRQHGDVGTDLASAATLFAIVDPALKWFGPVVVVALYGDVHATGPIAYWFAALPFIMQVVVATLIAEFGSYWSHRFHHRNTNLWWLHALHHGSERLYTFNNFRIHPLNYAINYTAGLLPLMLLGVSQQAILGYLALSYPVLMLQHANLDFRSGVLNYIFSTNEVHRGHHSTTPGEGDSNFGRALMIWDHVFGSFRYSQQGNLPRAIGLYGGSTYPARQSFFRQVASMFCPGCCAA